MEESSLLDESMHELANETLSFVHKKCVDAHQTLEKFELEKNQK